MPAAARIQIYPASCICSFSYQYTLFRRLCVGWNRASRHMSCQLTIVIGQGFPHVQKRLDRHKMLCPTVARWVCFSMPGNSASMPLRSALQRACMLEKERVEAARVTFCPLLRICATPLTPTCIHSIASAEVLHCCRPHMI